ncbi:MAG: triose-phosphate isomerase [Cyclobacteriaceae bacterium]
MRKKVVAGNWKMNTEFTEALQLASEVSNMVKDESIDGTEVIICVPFPYLSTLSKLVEGSSVKVAAQNCHHEESGAFTGEVSAKMLASINVPYVIVGHSERREYFGEDNSMLAGKIDQAFANDIRPVFCCGETLDIREEGTHEYFVANQMGESLFHLTEDRIKEVIIAYEPVWAIGTGKTASAEQAQEMHAALRAKLEENYGAEVADEVSILYGGSVKPGNAKEIFAGKDVDGGLIGGASLDSRGFVDIVKSF